MQPLVFIQKKLGVSISFLNSSTASSTYCVKKKVQVKQLKLRGYWNKVFSLLCNYLLILLAFFFLKKKNSGFYKL